MHDETGERDEDHASGGGCYPPIVCICETHALLAQGCTCGAMKAEREAQKQKE